MNKEKKETLSDFLKNKMLEYDKSIENWDNQDMDNFLFDCHLISKNTIQKYIYIIQDIIKQEYIEKGIEYRPIKNTKPAIEYSDLKRLRSKTPTYSEFRGIREELFYDKLDDKNNYNRGNYRDVVILELAMCGLTVNEIKLLKKEGDIEPYEDKLILHLPKRDVIIDNPDFIEDILKAKDEEVYYRDRVVKDHMLNETLELAWSPYLIRGTSTNGITKVGEPVTQLTTMLERQLKKIPHSILDMEHLSIADLRRAYIIMVINEFPDTDVNQLKKGLNKKQESDLAWLIPIAKKLKELE